MKKLTDKEQDLFERLPDGCEFAMTAKEIKEITGYEPRKIRELINSIRKKGGLIASGGFGYFKAQPECNNCKSLYRESANNINAQGTEQIEIAKIMFENLKQNAQKEEPCC